ncbi:hypothetical protein BpHYR1_032280 [Brachionus plicatilis]|uniref:Uncharacterized protein n=1 Tax=Brachionus plicatilis TaxID=10195 RepID=A0A3M7QEI8_BRAPC|nr:hypothetical protein BpHYR1_032280 [Brachionus plicatilis]
MKTNDLSNQKKKVVKIKKKINFVPSKKIFILARNLKNCNFSISQRLNQNPQFRFIIILNNKCLI